MSVKRIASRYAKSLIDLAIEQNKLETILGDINTFRKTTKHRDLQLLLSSPLVHADKKKSILNEIFKDKVDILSLKFFDLVVDKRREPHLRAIADEFILQYKRIKHISSVVITTAAPISKEALEEIKAKLHISVAADDNIEIETKLDPSLIGGFIIEFGDRLYDASVSHKLNNFKKEFDTNLYEKRF